ncbi:hypothetical protein [Clostridium thailandense]|uniref:hypothetical protein n=1 Tax=Clostridium thailandense TaxID=2794346 RepID=UPI0039895E87
MTREDVSGHIWTYVAGIALGAATGGISYVLAARYSHQEIDNRQLAIAIASGAVSGAINPFVTTKYSVVLFSAAMSAVTDLATQASKGGKINYSEVTYNFVTGAAIGRFGFKKPEVLIFSNKVTKNYKNTNYHIYKRPTQVDLTVRTTAYNVWSSTVQGASSNELFPGDKLWAGGYDNVDFGLG